MGGLSSEPKAHLLILRGAARLAEGGKGESEDIYGAEAVEILPRSLWYTRRAKRLTERAGRLASVGSVGRFGAQHFTTERSGLEISEARGGAYQSGVAVPYFSSNGSCFFRVLPFFKHYKTILYNRLSPTLYYFFLRRWRELHQHEYNYFRSFLIRA